MSEPQSSIDYWQQRGHLMSPEEWQEACRMFRARCSVFDCEQMARLRTYIETGQLVVVRPAPMERSEYRERPTPPPGADEVRTHTFWSPDRRLLMTVYVTKDSIQVADDNGDIYEAAGKEHTYG